MQRLQHIGRKLPMMRALLDDHEIVRPVQRAPDLGKLSGQHCPEQRSHAHAREIVAAPSDRAPA
jgi:hypothetical protein